MSVLHLSAGLAPNGSLASQPLSWGTRSAKAGKSYSLDAQVAAAKFWV